MKPIGWTSEGIRGRCERCDEQVSLSWEAYFDAIEHSRFVGCPSCGTQQAMRDRRQRAEAVVVDRRSAQPDHVSPTRP